MLGLGLEKERTRRCDLGGVIVGAQVEPERLATDTGVLRVIQVVEYFEPVAGSGQRREHRLAVGDHHRFGNRVHVGLGILFLESGLGDRVGEQPGRAVGVRRFGRVGFYRKIVYPHSPDRRKNVLDGLYGDLALG